MLLIYKFFLQEQEDLAELSTKLGQIFFYGNGFCPCLYNWYRLNQKTELEPSYQK